jgi:hypothetical protein
MARTIAQIQQSVTDAKNGINPNLPLSGINPLSSLTSTSNAAIWLLWTYVVAVCHWTLENLFDYHKAEVASILANQKPHALRWYVTKARAFQYGYTLPPDSDTYATPVTTPSVAIIHYAAAVEMTNLLRIKVAKWSGSALTPLTTGELTAFTAYMNLIKDAGVRLQITSGNPDTLRLVLNIYYNPLVLDGTGARQDGTAATPVQDAINNFLANLPFNGLFVVNNLIAALQQTDGVVIGAVLSVAATYGALPYTAVPVSYTPDAGYMVLDPVSGLTVTYIAHNPI